MRIIDIDSTCKLLLHLGNDGLSKACSLPVSLLSPPENTHSLRLNAAMALVRYKGRSANHESSKQHEKNRPLNSCNTRRYHNAGLKWGRTLGRQRLLKIRLTGERVEGACSLFRALWDVIADSHPDSHVDEVCVSNSPLLERGSLSCPKQQTLQMQAAHCNHSVMHSAA